MPRVLQLTNRVPFPPTDGGAIGIYNITKGLAENGCEIDLLAINTPKHRQPPDAMTTFARQYDVFVNTDIKLGSLIWNFLFSREPYNIERFYSKDVSAKLAELLTANTYDFIQLESAFVVKYLPDIRRLSRAPVIVRTHNIEYVIWDRLSVHATNLFKRWYFRMLSKRIKTFEGKMYPQANAIAAITHQDKQRLIDLGIQIPIEVIPAGVVLDKFDRTSNQPEQSHTLYSLSALDWMPNLEGLKWFLEEIWPQVLIENPSCQLHIAGKSTPEWLMQSKFPNVSVHGFVEDPVDFQKRYEIMIVPLLSGGGMRVKIIEGMAAERCIISTSIGAEGIQCQHNLDIIIADEPLDWVAQISQLLRNKSIRKEIAQNAKIRANQMYENRQITRAYIDLYHRIKANG